jgi:hypothetical protein
MNKVMEFKCNTCIILGYLHSPWNLEGYCIAIAKPIVPSKTLLGSSLKQDVFCNSIIFATKMQRWIFWRRSPNNNNVQKTPNTFHIGGGKLTFWNSFNYRLFCMSRFAETFVKMESKLNEIGKGWLECKYWARP